MIDSAETVVSVDLPARSWSVIDATMDNIARNSIFVFHEGAGRIAKAIRRAGWDQVPWVGADREWPPMTQLITIALTAAQWQFAMNWLDESAMNPIDDESAELCSSVLAVVRPQIPG